MGKVCYIKGWNNDKIEGEVKDKMDPNKPIKFPDSAAGIQINLNPDKTPTLYADSVFIATDDNGVVFSVAQKVDDKNQVVVARFGMSRNHAEKFAEVLGKHLELTTSKKIKQ